jgi:glycosyltransferase involved in cell wall biosynthesis
LPKLTYVTVDSIQEGVGQSQVLSYVKKLAKENEITLISLEKDAPNDELIADLEDHKILWRYIPFGKKGIVGGVLRMVRLCRLIPTRGIVHARSDIAALAGVLRGSRTLIWDCRALMADHRRALSTSFHHRIESIFFSFMERIVAKRSCKIIVITKAVIPILKSRYELQDDKFQYISTCVDTSKFDISFPLSSHSNELRILISGTLSPAYDVELMNKILDRLKYHTNVKVTLALAKNHDQSWKDLKFIDEILEVKHELMPQLITQMDFGFAIWRNDFGVALKSVAATKVAEFLACGVPVVVNSLQGDFGALVPANDVGVSIVNSSDDEIERVVSNLLRLSKDEKVHIRCREFALKNYDLSKAIDDLNKLYVGLEKSSST